MYSNTACVSAEQRVLHATTGTLYARGESEDLPEINAIQVLSGEAAPQGHLGPVVKRRA
jgi:hypothetical protein